MTAKRMQKVEPRGLTPEEQEELKATLQKAFAHGHGREQTEEDVKATIQRVTGKYAKHAVPIDELWEMMERALGDHTLTEELRAMREGR